LVELAEMPFTVVTLSDIEVIDVAGGVIDVTGEACNRSRT
jgi:nucleosome binding factor SPN SPT16 subunit